MEVKFSQDVVPVSEMKNNPARVIDQVAETHRPVLLTNRGKGVAVIQSLEDFEREAEERALMKAIAEGMEDLRQGRVSPLQDVKKRLRAKMK